ncbi:MAG: prepilin-type N-terminal cleavage/methylation domain-containing protein [Planctomycetota bacterium]|nr:prepilin-type N-terminal cleavage/methylation domain-containing protein [Planctomycetota bacterium]
MTPKFYCPLRLRAGLHRRRGLGLFELMISLAISATLLTAVGVAVNASSQAYQINQEQASLTQRSRLAMNRILQQIRNSQLHAPESAAAQTQFAGGAIVTDTGVEMIDSTGALVDYHFDAPNQQLVMIRNGVSYIMLHGVTAFSATLQPMQSPVSLKTGGAFDLLEQAQLTLSVKTVNHTANSTETTNTQTITLSSSVMPRKNVW